MRKGGKTGKRSGTKKSSRSARSEKTTTANSERTSAEASAESQETKPPRLYKDARDLVDAIYLAIDPVATAKRLLEGKDGAKVWIQLFDKRFERPVQQIEAVNSEGMKFNFITLAARPERELRNDAGEEEGS
jgi:hypothetical protein